MSNPPFTLTSAIVSLVAEISERLGRLSVLGGRDLRLRRVNRIRTIRGSLAIEGNTLSEQQVTAILEGKPVIAPRREVQEVQNALAAYEQMVRWQPHRENDLLEAHAVLMRGLVKDVGRYRTGGVGVMQGETVVHMAPSADRTPHLVRDLLAWLGATDAHPLIAGAVFHYEFEFIHPFSDGNGRMGRLWQTLVLSRWQPLLADLPVESLVHAHQAEYYRAIEQSTAQTDAAPFIEFMLRMTRDACISVTPAVAPEVTPQVKRLLSVLDGDMRREALMCALQLKDLKHFRQRYLIPALDGGWIELTQPDSPTSPTQGYRLTAHGAALIENGKEAP